MAVFLLNVCKFNECGIQFPNLTDLIHHIEANHIDYDPKVVEQKELQQPACLPLSYVLRFITDGTRKEPIPMSPVNASLSHNSSSSTATAAASLGLNGSSGGHSGNNGTHSSSPSSGHGNGSSNSTVGATTTAELKRKLAIKHHSYSISSSNRSNTPTGSEMDEEEMLLSQSEDSNDSWTTEEFSSEFIMRYGSRHSGGTGPNGTNEKPFACPVPGCKKRYKNVNGIKYHSKNGHKKDGKVRKAYKCHCGKSYKTSHGLKNHSIHVHNTDNIQLTQVPMGGPANGGGAPMVINQAIAPPPRNASMSPTGHTVAANSSTVQLSPASSISSLSSGNGGNATTLPMNGSSSHSNSSSPSSGVQSPPPSSMNTNTNGGNGGPLKSNYGLITIKGKSNILATRCVKLLTTTTAQQQQGGVSPPTPMSVDDTRLDLSVVGGRGGGNGGQLLQHSSSASAVVNLGILTPATSPRNGSSHQHQSGGGGSMSSASSTSSGCSSMESLPLTPVSPTQTTTTTNSGVSLGKLEGATALFGGTLTQDLISGGGGGGGVMAQVSALMAAVGGGGGGVQSGVSADSEDHLMLTEDT